MMNRSSKSFATVDTVKWFEWSFIKNHLLKPFLSWFQLGIQLWKNCRVHCINITEWKLLCELFLFTCIFYVTYGHGLWPLNSLFANVSPHLKKSEFRNKRKQGVLLNVESWALESAIQLRESRINVPLTRTPQSSYYIMISSIKFTREGDTLL